MANNFLNDNNMHYKVFLDSSNHLTVDGLGDNILISYDLSNTSSHENLMINKMNTERELNNSKFIYYEVCKNELLLVDKLNNKFDPECYFNDLKKNDFTIIFIENYLKKINNGKFNDAEEISLLKFLYLNEIKTALYILQYIIFNSEGANRIGRMLIKGYLKFLIDEKDIHIKNNIMYIEFYLINLLDLNTLNFYS